MTETIDRVRLQFNTEVLTKSLRYAFADRLAVVRELIQNARRAGATKVSILLSKAADAGTILTVMDDGNGIDDFQVLLTIAASDWDEDTVKTEGPYGMGFISTLYSVDRVRVVSKGKALDLSSSEVLQNASALVDVALEVLPHGNVTAVSLFGFDMPDLRGKLLELARGYPIPILVDGKALPRPHAVDTRFVDSEVGSVLLHGDYYSTSARVYLQGFEVYKTKSSDWEGATLVHLDPRKWFGKFPDRNVVIDQDIMLANVNAEIRRLYVAKLLNAKATMPPMDFLMDYYELARTLDMLEVFDDIPYVPRRWFASFHMPAHYSVDGATTYLWIDEKPVTWTEADFYSREALEAERPTIAMIDPYVNDVNCFIWHLARSQNALVLNEDLHEGHWLCKLVTIDSETEVELVEGDFLRECDSWLRAFRVPNPFAIRLVRNLAVRSAGKDHPLLHPVFLEEPPLLLIPLGDDRPHYVLEEHMQQNGWYCEDDAAYKDYVAADAALANQVARELFATDPKERAALAIEAALASYGDVRSLECTFQINQHGHVVVKELSST